MYFSTLEGKVILCEADRGPRPRPAVPDSGPAAPPDSGPAAVAPPDSGPPPPGGCPTGTVCTCGEDVVGV